MRRPKWTSLILLTGLALSVTALVLAPGLGSAAAAVAFTGWAYEHALRGGERDRLRQAGVELEGAAAREQFLLLHAFGYRLPGKADAEVSPTKH